MGDECGRIRVSVEKKLKLAQLFFNIFVNFCVCIAVDTFGTLLIDLCT